MGNIMWVCGEYNCKELFLWIFFMNRSREIVIVSLYEDKG